MVMVDWNGRCETPAGLAGYPLRLMQEQSDEEAQSQPRGKIATGVEINYYIC
jgi:hypothetical protein